MTQQSDLIRIGTAARLLGVTPQTLRKWEATGYLVPVRKSPGGTRYYSANQLLGQKSNDLPTVCYARVSSQDQKADLDRQHVLLESYCAAQGWSSLVIRDLGSGMNYRKKGLHQLLELILERRMRRLVITHKDRLLRFGAELVFTLCELNGIEVVVIHQGEHPASRRSWRRTCWRSSRCFRPACMAAGAGSTASCWTLWRRLCPDRFQQVNIHEEGPSHRAKAQARAGGLVRAAGGLRPFRL